MTTHVHRTTRPAGARTAVSPVDRRGTRVVLGSLATGVAAATLLTMVALPGATEGVTTGSTLLAFGLAWALLRVRSARTARPQRWATIPAVAMTATGLVLMVLAPSDRAITALTWVWPPLMLVLAGWTYLRMRRSLTGGGRWLVTVVLALLAATSAGAGVGNLS